MYRAVVTLLSLIFLLAPIPAQAEEWVRYSDLEAGFSVSYPKGWVVLSDVSPDEFNVVTGDPLGIVGCWVVHPNSDGFKHLSHSDALKAFSGENYLLDLRKNSRSAELVEEKQGSLSGISANHFKVRFTDSQVNPEKLILMESDVSITFTNGKPYSVGCTWPRFSAWDEVNNFELFRQSFKILHGD